MVGHLRRLRSLVDEVRRHLRQSTLPAKGRPASGARRAQIRSGEVDRRSVKCTVNLHIAT